jgi:hypothetical protein
MNAMKEAYLLLRSSALLDGEQGSRSAAVVRLDRIHGPYTVILRARGSRSEIEQLAAHVGIGARDVCWLTEARVKGGDSST